MASEQAPPSVNVLLEMLHEVLEPLGERRPELMALIAHEMKTMPVVQFCCDKAVVVSPDLVRTCNTWKLGEPSPTDESTIVFAMLHDLDQRAVIVYTFQATESGEEYAYTTQFFREVIFDPALIQGPIHHDALFAQLRTHLLEEDEIAIASRVCLEAAEQMPDDSGPMTREKLLEVAAYLDTEPGEEDAPQPNGDAAAEGADA
jgi:hypothetical protein